MGNRGFTLIEVIILIVMAGILLPAIIVPFVAGVKGSGKPEKATTAIYLAHYKMEEFMKFQYTDPAIPRIPLTSNADPGIPGISGYQWQWEIEFVDPTNFNNVVSPPGVGYKRILVRVTDPENNTYEVYSVITYFP